ncbi:glycosyltransferase [Candidatus Micrarchaeota archaeon]|nr:glycosyltransferase [Candidatus Micrarchaeota archaeon]
MNFCKKNIPLVLLFFFVLLSVYFSFIIINLTNIFSLIFFICIFLNAVFLLSSYFYYLTQKEDELIKTSFEKEPSVAVVCTFSGEDKEIVKNTLVSMKNIKYENKKLYLLDDSKGKKLKEELKRYCTKNNIQYVSRENNNNFKAGNLNNFIFNYCNEEFLIIFDKDDFKLVDPNIIIDLLPFFKDNKLAYIQTKKTTINGTIFENAIKETNAFFYNLIQPINNKKDAALFGGSLALMDVKILKKLGGFPNYLIEDIAYSFKALINGYKGKYINKSYCLSYKIESYSEFQKQQFRYNFSNTRLLFDCYIKNITKIPFKLHFNFLIQFLGLHFLSVSQFVSSIFLIFFLMYIPATYNFYISLLLFVFLFPFSILVFSKIYNNSYKIGIFAYLINFSLILTRISALIKGIFKSKPNTYGVTGLGKNKFEFKKVINRSVLGLICFIFLLSPIFFIPFNFIYLIIILWNACLFLTTFLFLYLFG